MLRGILVVAVAFGACARVAAQAVPPNAPPGAAANAPSQLEQFVVTGTHIPTTETAAEARFLPVQIFDRPAIDQSGFDSTAELLQRITVSNGDAVPVANNNVGWTPAASSTSIHGLGPEATLVLINGHRVANFPIGHGGTRAFVDLNTIPLSAVSRVEVLTDGASPIYGADAVAGVVNISLRSNVDGTTGQVRYSNTTEKDAHLVSASVVTGVRFAQGSLTLVLNYSRHAALFNRDRSYSRDPPLLSTNSSPLNLQITRAAYDEALGLPAGTPPPGIPATRAAFFASPGVFPGAPGGNTVPANGDPVTGGTNKGSTPASQYIYGVGRPSVYNYNYAAGAFPESHRLGIIMSGEHALFGRGNVTAYFDASLQRNDTENQLAPTPTGNFTAFGSTELVIPARTPNPLPLPDGRARAAPVGAYNPFNPFNVDIAGGSRGRLSEFGNRIFRDRVDAALATVGLRVGRPADAWSLDAGGRFSWIQDRSDYTGVSATRFNRVLNQADPIFNPASPSFIGTTTAYNPFGYYVNPIATNRGVVDYAAVHARGRYTSWLANGFATVTHPKLVTWRAGEIGVAVGIDARRESLAQAPSEFNFQGDILGNGGESAANHARDVVAFFAEAKVPLIAEAQAVSAVRLLGIDLAARSESFLTSHTSDLVPKIGLRWVPLTPTFAVRASFGRGIRQPTLHELYLGDSAGYIGTLTDPRTGEKLTEVPRVIRGNPLLLAERSKSTTAGFVWSPHWHGLLLSFAADGWNVERNGTVSVHPLDMVARYFGTSPGGRQAGEEVRFDADGAINLVIAPYQNSGRTQAKGVDFTGSGRLPTPNRGTFELSGAASYLGSMRVARLPGAPTQELVNQDASGGIGADGYLRWKGRSNLRWSGRRLTLGLGANFTDGFQDLDLAGQPFQVAATWTFDCRIEYALPRGSYRLFGNVKISAGVENFTDREPPRSYGGGNNSTGFPGFTYTGKGRIMYAAVQKRF